mgnify:CR=1 FL=1
MPYDSLSDEALVEHIARRETAALSALYDRYARHAHAVALLVTHDSDQAAAVVEELFWRVWQQGRPPTPGTTLRNSLMLSARRLAGSESVHPQIPQIPERKSA